MVVVGLDVGYGETKLYSATGGKKFPTLIAPARGEALGESEVITLPDGREFEIGVLTGAIDTRDPQFVLSPAYKAVVLYALRNYAGKEVILGLGSPINWDRREELKRIFEGEHRFFYNGREVKLAIKAFPFLQGWGGYIDSIYTLEGKYLEKEDVPALYIDVGYNTIDTMLTEQVFIGGKLTIRPKKVSGGTIEGGVSRFLEILRFQLEKRGLRVPSVRLLEFIETGKTKNPYPAGTYREAKETALGIYREEVKSSLEKIYRDYEHFIEKIHIFGGGTNLIKPLLEEFGKPITEGDEFSNARGFYKAAKAKVTKTNSRR